MVHSKLLYKLQNIGLPDLVIRWISAFLSNRSQAVIIDHILSPVSPVISGVPQGSVLGPILFILFINDLETLLNGKAEFKLFADDLKIYSSFSNPTAHTTIQDSLILINSWSSTWQLPINHSKSQVLHLGNAATFSPYQLGDEITPAITSLYLSALF